MRGIYQARDLTIVGVGGRVDQTVHLQHGPELFRPIPISSCLRFRPAWAPSFLSVITATEYLLGEELD